MRRKKKNICLLKKKNIISIVFIFLTAIAITLILLGIVTLFEERNIHVSGSREMWIGLIGALLGGAYTLLGVQMTLYYQEKNDIEKQRIENLPILKFESKNVKMERYNGPIFTLDGNEIYTSGFPKDDKKPYPILVISLANNAPAFDVYVESCITTEHNQEVVKNKAYAPMGYRLVAEEKIETMFWILDYCRYSTCNVLGVLRVSYSDMFGNRYFQDVPFSYSEQVSREYNILELDSIKAPTLVEKSLNLVDLVRKEYDYIYND